MSNVSFAKHRQNRGIALDGDSHLPRLPQHVRYREAATERTDPSRAYLIVTDEPCATPLTCPGCKGQNTTKSIESMLREIHICRDCLRTFVIEKPPLRKPPASLVPRT